MILTFLLPLAAGLLVSYASWRLGWTSPQTTHLNGPFVPPSVMVRLPSRNHNTSQGPSSSGGGWLEVGLVLVVVGWIDWFFAHHLNAFLTGASVIAGFGLGVAAMTVGVMFWRRRVEFSAVWVLCGWIFTSWLMWLFGHPSQPPGYSQYLLTLQASSQPVFALSRWFAAPLYNFLGFFFTILFAVTLAGQTLVIVFSSATNLALQKLVGWRERLLPRSVGMLAFQMGIAVIAYLFVSGDLFRWLSTSLSTLRY